ncbi:TrmH family RNA methyltransferase [Namhaeicola litoreus]|uniref:TrmH family RNA methyltransferase n=1 Tax=Namhaeicola litoreus TaxID=1052145 RepID=A0ABW3Y0E7_9FLAO
MVSNKQLKLLNQLKQKKYRNEYNLFVAEGIKTVKELMNADFEIHQIFALEDFFNQIQHPKSILISPSELKKISNLKSPNEVLGIFEFPKKIELDRNGITLVLDDINDPGNLGTIIRLCDWFDVRKLVCSKNTVDCYNPKVVQASMGSIARVSIIYEDLETYLKPEKRPIYGTFLEGGNIYQNNLEKEAVIIMGNEANGISAQISQLIQHKITIPQFGQNQATESLNVSTATAIILSEFKRKTSF